VDTALLQAVRTLFVWIINLLIFAVASAFVPDASDQLQPVLPGNSTSSTAAGVVPAAGFAAGSSLLLFPSGSGSSSSGASIGLLEHQQQRQGFHALWWKSLLQQQHGIGSRSLQQAAAAEGFMGVGAAAGAVGSAAPGPSQLVDVASQLPGEPWLAWSFLQAAGFLILVLGELGSDSS
jgi:hypothetical protein